VHSGVATCDEDVGSVPELPRETGELGDGSRKLIAQTTFQRDSGGDLALETPRRWLLPPGKYVAQARFVGWQRACPDLSSNELDLKFGPIRR